MTSSTQVSLPPAFFLKASMVCHSSAERPLRAVPTKAEKKLFFYFELFTLKKIVFFVVPCLIDQIKHRMLLYL